MKCYTNVEVSAILTEGFTYGFKLNYDGPRFGFECDNLKSINKRENEAISIAMKEVRLGRLAGPFLFKPFENLLVSPVGLIPKKRRYLAFDPSFIFPYRS